MADPTKPIYLTGKAARDFERYQRRTPTRAELDFAREADRIYRENPPVMGDMHGIPRRNAAKPVRSEKAPKGAKGKQ